MSRQTSTVALREGEKPIEGLGDLEDHYAMLGSVAAGSVSGN